MTCHTLQAVDIETHLDQVQHRLLPTRAEWVVLSITSEQTLRTTTMSLPMIVAMSELQSTERRGQFKVFSQY